MAVPFMGLYVTEALHRSNRDAGIIILCFGVGSILGAAVGGKLTDMFGFRPVQIFSSIIGGAFFLGFSLVTDFTVLCVFSLLISFFYDAFRPANFTAIAAYASPGNETRSYSLNRLATNVGWAFGISMGGIIASYNYKLLFLVDGVVSIGVGIAIWMLLPTIKGFRKAFKEKAEAINVAKPWRDFSYIKFLLLTVLFATCFFLMFRVAPVLHLNEAIIGLILGINGVIIALFEMVMISTIENKKSITFYIVAGVLVVGFSFGCLMIPKFMPEVVALISIICFTFGEMLSIPFMNTIVIKRSNEFNRGQYAAGNTVAWSVAQVIGPISGFYLAEKFGYNALWIGITVLLVFCAYGFSKNLRNF